MPSTFKRYWTYMLFSNYSINFLVRLAITQASLFFLYATTLRKSGLDAINWVGATDAYSYLMIASAAPGFPAEQVAFHFAQRWVPHYLIGIFSNVFGVNIYFVYALACFILCQFIFWITLDLLLKSTTDKNFAILLFLFVLLSPFSLRLFIFVPELLADLVFMFGVTIVFYGLFRRNIWWIILGIIIGTAGKQLFLLLLPGLALYVWYNYRIAIGQKRAIVMSALVTIVTISIYYVLSISSRSFASENSITGKVLFALMPWIFSEKFSVSLFGEHLLRTLLPLSPFLGMLLIFWLSQFIETGRRCVERLKSLFTIETIALSLMVLGPIAYAFLPGPLVQMGNQSRYVAINLLPMAVLTCRLIPYVRLQIATIDYWLLGGIICIFSFHHRYTFIQSIPEVFLIIHLIALAMFLLWFKSQYYCSIE